MKNSSHTCRIASHTHTHALLVKPSQGTYEGNMEGLKAPREKRNTGPRRGPISVIQSAAKLEPAAVTSSGLKDFLLHELMKSHKLPITKSITADPHVCEGQVSVNVSVLLALTVMMLLMQMELVPEASV